jgi:hypothetical protein
VSSVAFFMIIALPFKIVVILKSEDFAKWYSVV